MLCPGRPALDPRAGPRAARKPRLSPARLGGRIPDLREQQPPLRVLLPAGGWHRGTRRWGIVPLLDVVARGTALRGPVCRRLRGDGGCAGDGAGPSRLRGGCQRPQPAARTVAVAAL